MAYMVRQQSSSRHRFGRHRNQRVYDAGRLIMVSITPINPGGVPPGGWNYTEAATGWSYPDVYAGTWGQLINAIIQHRQANPKYGLSLVQSDVEYAAGKQIYDRLSPVDRDRFFRVSDTSYVPPPTAQKKTGVAAFVDRLRSDAKGAEILSDWLGAGGEPETTERATERASICRTCPHNVPAKKIETWLAARIKQYEEVKHSITLKTEHDADIKGCSVCGCWLPLKVWVPVEHLKNDADDFPSHCWIRKERSEHGRLEHWRRTDLPEIAKQNPWPAGVFSIPEFHGALHFNPGLATVDGKQYLYTRRFIHPMSQVAVAQLNPDMSLGPRALLSGVPFPDQESLEDPRLTWWNGKLFLSACVYNSSFPGHQSLFELSGASHAVARHEIPVGHNARFVTRNTGWEKNWIFFEDHERLYLIYQITGSHLVYHIGPNWETTRNWSTPSFSWPFGDPRGGTPPIRRGNEYVCFFHSSLPYLNARRYYMGAYAFEAKEPFRITRHTRLPIAAGSNRDVWAKDSKPVIFPSGAHFTGNDWTVVYGINDAACGWMKIPDHWLNEALQ